MIYATFLDDVRGWSTLLISCSSLLAILLSAVKVFNRQEEEWRDRERRLIVIETEVITLKRLALDIVEIKTKLGEFSDESRRETIRIRERLDKFIDREIRKND